MPSHIQNVCKFLILAVVLGWPAQTLFAEDSPGDSDAVVKVVYHADFADPRRFSAMLTSINNMVTFYQNELVDYDVRIVFVAHGIRFLTDDKLKDTPFSSDAALDERRGNLYGRLSALNSVQGVKLELCDITRSGIGLPEDDLYKGVELVPSGVVRIAELQSRGYAYIKIE
ncbi:MAG: DsrE family protein [Gammaproteobacteria bacterium]|jgi:intracellular sulfur oxidation DsrE/DsrF family protein|nr:DsrE family protein [Gammaproteobacteria bacterium]MDH3888715.1 DsrE family protein [Gammaproteobacteria bacterium]MDH3934969.1 DsrE family protein [Gammaproteobacteria bacterium]MDH3985663.1 DsrE family protein [Gammaproteobacteria bacterium]